MKSAILLVALLFFCSCDTRKDFNAGLNLMPQIQIRKDDSNFNPQGSYQQILTDSLKLSQSLYYFDYWLQTNETPPSVSVTVNITGTGFFQNPVEPGMVRYVFCPNTVGFQSVNFKVVDAYGLTAASCLNLTTFFNLPPVAKLTYLNTSVLDPLQYKLDASGSYDKDAKYGGAIINYQFSISPNYQVITPYNSISYIFPSPGNYQITLRVEDNDNEWSPGNVLYINVP